MKLSNPEVSVVMSVYNGAKYLRESLESILSQEGVDFEFIIVNDGSTDDSGDILAEYASQDNRISILEHENVGLTRSLIKGCNVASGKFIARQDTGDVSLPGRLNKQLEHLKSNKEVTLVSCWAIFTGPEGEELYRVERHDSPAEATRKLRISDLMRFQGISHHGSAMFRKNDYIRAGGYREQFYFAQDLDLWLRLTDIGLLSFIEEVLYKARLSVSCISTKHHDYQVELTHIIIKLAKAREQDGDESDLLQQATTIKPSNTKSAPRDKANGLYFIGKCLIDRKDRRGIKYLKKAVKFNPLLLKAWFHLFLVGFRNF